MDLKDFYLQNIKKDEYHYYFHDLIKKVNNEVNFDEPIESEDCNFEIYDSEEAKKSFGNYANQV